MFQAWTECVDNSLAQLEHQRTRILNLDLMLGKQATQSFTQYVLYSNLQRTKPVTIGQIFYSGHMVSNNSLDH